MGSRTVGFSSIVQTKNFLDVFMHWMLELNCLTQKYHSQQREVSGIAQPGKGGEITQGIKRFIPSKPHPSRLLWKKCSCRELLAAVHPKEACQLLLCSSPAGKCLNWHICIALAPVSPGLRRTSGHQNNAVFTDLNISQSGNSCLISRKNTDVLPMLQ